MSATNATQQMAQFYYNRMYLLASTLVKNSQFISEDDVGRLIGDIINDANALVHLTPPESVPVSDLKSFAKGLAVETILTCIKQFKDRESNDALGIFYRKCSKAVATNEIARSAVAEALGDLSGKDNMFEAIKYAEDAEILRRMLNEAQS